MRSLRVEALLVVTLLLALVGVGCVALAYRLASREVYNLLDGQLQQIAVTAAGRPSGIVGPPVPHDKEDEFVIVVRDRSGKVVSTTDQAFRLDHPLPDGLSNITVGGYGFRVYAAHGDDHSIVVAQREDVRSELIGHAASYAVLPSLAFFPVAWLGFGFAIRRFSARLGLIAADIAQRSLHKVRGDPPVSVPREIVPLIEAIDTLTARLDAAFARQTRFVSDAAHELRTPLAALRIQIYNLGHQARTAQAWTADGLGERFAELESGVARMSSLVDQLLRITRLDAGQGGPAEIVDLRELISACVSDLLPLGDSRNIDLGFLHADSVSILCSPTDARVVFFNLLDNAIRYAPVGSQVDVTIRHCDGNAMVEIADRGPGIPVELLDRVFERFFRAAPAHIEGNGLGLAIVKAAADACGLKVTLAPRTPCGLLATVTGRTHMVVAASGPQTGTTPARTARMKVGGGPTTSRAEV